LLWLCCGMKRKIEKMFFIVDLVNGLHFLFVRYLHKHKDQMVYRLWSMWHIIAHERSNRFLNLNHTLAKIVLCLLKVIADTRRIGNWSHLNSNAISVGMSGTRESSTSSLLWGSIRIVVSIRLFINISTTNRVPLHNFRWCFRSNIIGTSVWR